MSRRTLISALAVSALGVFATAGMSSASCVAPEIANGRYENVDPDTRSITALSLEFVCGASYVENADGTATLAYGGDPHWNVRLWGSCHPTDCDWGNARGTTDAGGRILTSYDQGFANRRVRIVPAASGLVQLVVTSHYTDGRPTRTWSEYLRLR